MSRWFLSYHSPDQALAERLKAAIECKDSAARLFFAPTHLRAGGSWSEQLAQEIAEATAFILLVGAAGIGKWQVPEYDEALDKWVNSGRKFPLIVVLLEGQTAPGLPFLRQLHWIITTDPASEADIARLFDAASGGGGSPGELWRYTSPYRGLEAMEEKDSDYFFGRKRETVDVLSALAGAPDRLPVLIGNSGVGKSSLVQAGVLAALKRQAWPEEAGAASAWPTVFQDSRQWCFLSLKPGTDPLKALVESFLDTWQFAATDPERVKHQHGWIELLGDGKATLPDLIEATERRRKELDQPKPPGFFLYVDQGEELYVRAEERQRRRFSELLAQALPDPRLRAIMSLRSDFLGHLQNDEPLFKARQQIDVAPLREAELYEIVSRPPQLLAARFETEGLVDVISRCTAEDSVKDVGALPLLSYTLDDMWTQMVRRGDGTLRLPAQSFELGGVLVDRANRFLATHPGAEAALRRVLTLRCATVREDGEPTRRRAPREEFSDEEWRLVSELANYPNRLLVTVTTEAGTYAEVAHEAIFRRWNKLRDWIASERDFLAWKSALEADRRQWEQASEQLRNDALLMGLALAQAQSWLAKRAEDLPRADREFIDLSLRREALERRQREKRRRRVLGFAIAALVVVTGLAVFGFLQWGRAKQALATFALGAASVLQGADPDELIYIYDEAIKLDPKNAIYYYGRGFGYLAKDDNDKAIADFDHAILLNSNLAFVYLTRGSAYLKKRQYDRAISDFTEVIRLDPKFALLAYQKRGGAYGSKGDYDRAIADFDQLVKLNPKLAIAYLTRGSAYLKKRQYDRAMDFTEAIRLDPKSALAYKVRGDAYESKGDYDRAVADYDLAIKFDPENAIIYNNRGWVYLKKRQYDRAISDFTEAIRLDPKFALAYQNRGDAYNDKGEFDHAIADYSKAIELVNDVPSIELSTLFINRGRAHTNNGDYDGALADFDQAVKLNPKYIPAFFVRGNAHVNKGDYARAIDDFEQVVRQLPNQAHKSVIWLHIIRTRSGQNDTTEFANNAEKLDRTLWPWPVIALFLGSLSPEAVLAAVKSDRRDQICQADFYLGIYQLEKGAHDKARRLFQSAADGCPRNLLEYQAAKLESERLR